MFNKETEQQVLGCLMKNPSFLNEVDKFNLTPMDFSNKLEKYIFTAIHGLYFNGASQIQIIDIENYLSTNPSAKYTFEVNQGIEYLQDIEEFAEVENFSYYYEKLKKFNLLRDLKKDGFDISEFYEEDFTSINAYEVNKNFEQLSSTDIVNNLKKKLIKLENEYATPEEVQTWRAADEIDELIENLGTLEEVGLSIQGEIYSQVINGAELGAFTVRSSSSGGYKTRMAVADACYLAYPIRFNSKTYKWEKTQNCEKVLFIITEQRKKEILKMILAYLTDINESRFKFARFSKEEENRIKIASELMKRFADNMIIIRMPEPTIGLIKSNIRKECIINDIKYCFFDYVFINPALLQEFRGTNLRNDELLLLMSTALKDLAVELNISVFTSTQVNASADNNTKIRNESTIAGSRAIINKADNGCVMARPTTEDLDMIKDLSVQMPNLVTDIYKVRNGEWSQVRIWSYFDGGTMRRKDLFITDAQFNIIENFFNEPKPIIENFSLEQKTEIETMIYNYNEGIFE